MYSSNSSIQSHCHCTCGHRPPPDNSPGGINRTSMPGPPGGGTGVGIPGSVSVVGMSMPSNISRVNMPGPGGATSTVIMEPEGVASNIVVGQGNATKSGVPGSGAVNRNARLSDQGMILN